MSGNQLGSAVGWGEGGANVERGGGGGELGGEIESLRGGVEEGGKG